MIMVFDLGEWDGEAECLHKHGLAAGLCSRRMVDPAEFDFWDTRMVSEVCREVRSRETSTAVS